MVWAAIPGDSLDPVIVLHGHVMGKQYETISQDQVQTPLMMSLYSNIITPLYTQLKNIKEWFLNHKEEAKRASRGLHIPHIQT